MFQLSDLLKHKLNTILFLYTCIWAIPIAFQVLGYSRETLVPIVMLCGLAGILCSIYLPESTLLSIPFLALLAPIAGDITLIGQTRIWTDYLVPVYFCIAVYFQIAKRKNKSAFTKREFIFLLCLIFLYLISFSTAHINHRLPLTEPLYYLACFLLIFWLFKTTATSLLVCKKILLAFQIAVCLGCLLVIYAYLAGQQLLLVRSDENYASIAAEQFFRPETHRRATYYYAGFHFVLGMLISGNLLRLQHGLDGKTTKALLWLQCGLLLTTALFLNNKTVLYAVLLSWLISLWFTKPKLSSLVFTIVLVFFVVGIFLSFENITRTISYSILNPLDAVTETSSLNIRTEVWQNALNTFFDSPRIWCFGYGPSVLEIGDPQISNMILVSQKSGGKENALDSTWLTWLLELGVFSFLFLVTGLIYLLKTLRKAGKTLLKTSPYSNFYYTICGGLLYCVFAFVIQSIGYAKISWFFILFFLMGILLNKNLQRRV